MSRKIGVVAVLIAAVLVTMGLAGCVSEGDDVDWTKPTQAMLDDIDVNEANETLSITVSLADKEGVDTRASGSVRIAIWDSMGFEMLNKSYDVSSKDFDAISILGLKLSSYTFEIPFSDLAKSHDRGYDTLAGDNAMHGMASFTYKETTFSDTYDMGWLNPTIPDALLLPNEDPQADLMVTNPGYVGMSVVCNGSASTDLEGGLLSYEWDWGDGDVISSLIGEAEESHIYDTAGTYTITMKITDPEDASAVKQMDVTVDWALDISISSWGIVAEGTYLNQTYVEILIDNMAPAEISTPTAGVDGILLKDAADMSTENNGTDIAIPATIAIDGDVTIMVYFDPAEGFTATQIDIWGRMLALP